MTGTVHNKIDTYKKILSDPHLLENITTEIQKKVVGEKQTIQTILLHCCGIWVHPTNHQIASYNLHINDQPGLGKDYIMKSTIEIFPHRNRVYRTKITPQVLAYWHNANTEPDWTWDDKILYLEDISDEILKSDVFKIMASGGSEATVLIKQKPIDIKIQGKPVIIITSYKTDPNDENLRRFPILNCDETLEQTNRIMQRQADNAANGGTGEYNTDITNALGLLNPRKIRIPYADKLPTYFPKNRLMRTHFHRFLDLIKASAALHQFQREMTGEYILATLDDYDYARGAILSTTTNSQMVPLTKLQKQIMGHYKDNKEWYSVPDILDKFPCTEMTLRKHLDKLFSYGLLLKGHEDRETSKKPVMVYRFNDKEFDVRVPASTELGLNITNINNYNSGDNGGSTRYDLKKLIETYLYQEITTITNITNIRLLSKQAGNPIFDIFNIFDIFDIFDIFNNNTIYTLPHNNTNTTLEGGPSPHDSHITNKIRDVMENHPAREWSLGELVDKTGIPHKDLFPVLENNTCFVRVDNDGIFYHLKKSSGNNGGV